MTATASKIDGFVNTYTVQSTDYSVTTDVSIAKKLEGRALMAGEFTFQLLEGNKVVSEGINDADGNVTFKSIKYTSADLGEHAYKVREVAGKAGGVNYDKSEYDVTVSVTDNHNGMLSAKASSDGAIEFKNSYAAEPTSVSFSATKVLDGAELKDGQFSFVLKDNEGVVEIVDGMAGRLAVLIKVAGFLDTWSRLNCEARTSRGTMVVSPSSDQPRRAR